MNYTFEPQKWVENYADLLYSHAFFKTNHKEIAEDLVQETLLSAYKNKDSFQFKASEKTWLFGILKHKIIDYYRKKINSHIKDEGVTIDYFFNQNEDDQNYQHWTQVAIPQAIELDGQNLLEQKELRDKLRECFQKLPDKLNMICHLKLIEEEKTDTICKEFNITQTNLWVLLHRAKLQLRACLQTNWIQH